MPVVSFAIRSLQPGDEGACGAIVASTPLWQRYGLSGSRAAELLAAAPGAGDQVVVASDGIRIAGFAWWMARGAFGRSPYLRLIGVDEAVRGHAIGAALLEAFEADAATRASDCMLLVSDFNVGAQRFYQRHGYVEVGRLPDYVLKDVTEIIYRKVLRS
jgi:ribosomal protein S18 acetylase RimI-like enzyme